MKLKEKEFEEIIQDLKSVASQLGAGVRLSLIHISEPTRPY